MKWEIRNSLDSVVNEVEAASEEEAIAAYARLTDLNISKVRSLGYTARPAAAERE